MYIFFNKCMHNLLTGWKWVYVWIRSHDITVVIHRCSAFSLLASVSSRLPCSTSLSNWQCSPTTTSWSSPSGPLEPEPPPAPWASVPPCSPSQHQLLHPWSRAIPAQGLPARATAEVGGWSWGFHLWGWGCGWGCPGSGSPCRTPNPSCTAAHLQPTYHLRTGGDLECGSWWRQWCGWGRWEGWRGQRVVSGEIQESIIILFSHLST